MTTSHRSSIAPASTVRTLLAPESVVIVGASASPDRMPGAPLRNLVRHGYGGRITAVNPKREEIEGIPCVPSILDLEHTPDTAVIVVAADQVTDALRQCAQRGIPTATVVASGFGEGAAGAAGQDRLVELEAVLAETGIRILGPNTAGLMNLIDSYVPRAALNHPDELLVGSTALVTQSGAMCNLVTTRAQANQVGLSHAVATGSQLDVDVWDVGAHLLGDGRVSSIAFVIEGFKDAAKFEAVARQAREVGKPLIVLKLGVSELGGRVVGTHSGAISGSGQVQASVLAAENVIQVTEPDELWEVAQLIQRWGPPTTRTERLGVVSISGGEAALGADEVDRVGMTLPEPSSATLATLDGAFELATGANPFDTGGEPMRRPELIGQAVNAMLDDGGYDAVVFATPPFAARYASRFFRSALDGMSGRPEDRVAIAAWSAGELAEDGIRLLRSSDRPVFEGLQRTVRAIALYDRYAAGLGSTTDRPERERSMPPTATVTVADYWSSRAALGSAVTFNRAERAGSASEAVEVADRIGYPVTIKASSPRFVHKVASGAVRLLVADSMEARTAAEELCALLEPAGLARGDDGLIVERYVASASAAIVGGSRDPDFGPVLAIGLGGGYVEAYGDVAHVRCPASEREIAQALDRTTFGAVIARQPLARTKLIETARQLSAWFAHEPAAAAFDVNPLLIGLDDDVVAVDARVEWYDRPT